MSLFQVNDMESAKSKQQKDRFVEILDPHFKLAAAFGLGWKETRFFKIYTHITLVLLLYCLCRGVSFFRDMAGFDPPLVFKCLLLLYATHCQVAYWMIRSIARTELAKFMSLWRRASAWRADDVYFVWLKRTTILGIAYVVSVSIVNGLYVALGSINFFITFPFMESYFVLEELELVNGLIVFFTSFAFCVSQTIYLSICMVILFEYKHFNDYFFSLSKGDVVKDLPALRFRHLLITEMTDHADAMLSSYAFCIYSFNSPTLVMTAFLLVREAATMGAMSLFTFASWVAILILQMAVVSVAPSIVFWEISLFINQLSSRGIGITGGGFFLITKPLLLTAS